MIENFRYLAINTYHVDPGIFVFLMLASIPPYYYGWYGLLRGVIRFRKEYKDKSNNLKPLDVLTRNYFIWPLVINRSAWVMPYIYVIFWGENLPLWFWILFIGWIFISGYLFWNKIKQKIIK
ncbi:MAG: hypothetical protein PHW75_02005 [Patescibacteria group bacterium]|nr:hypothetical protein [Patescibacteria group bacterium]